MVNYLKKNKTKKLNQNLLFILELLVTHTERAKKKKPVEKGDYFLSSKGEALPLKGAVRSVQSPLAYLKN